MLAVEFVRSGWDIKHMLKLIACSSTYRQSSLVSAELRTKDPLNRLLARQGRYRYPASRCAIRPSQLVACSWRPSAGRASIRTSRPVTTVTSIFRFANMCPISMIANGDAVFTCIGSDNICTRCSRLLNRIAEECTVERPRSNTAPAALVLLNDPTLDSPRRYAFPGAHQPGPRPGGDRIRQGLHLAGAGVPILGHVPMPGHDGARDATAQRDHDLSRLRQGSTSPGRPDPPQADCHRPTLQRNQVQQAAGNGPSSSASRTTPSARAVSVSDTGAG